MQWWYLEYIDVSRRYGDNSWHIYYSERFSFQKKKLRTCKHKEEAVFFGKYVAEFKGCWYRQESDNRAYIEYRYKYGELDEGLGRKGETLPNYFQVLDELADSVARY
jgi:hypothetical protein